MLIYILSDMIFVDVNKLPLDFYFKLNIPGSFNHSSMA